IGNISSDEILSDNNISTNPNSDIENANNKLIAKPNLRKNTIGFGNTFAKGNHHKNRKTIQSTIDKIFQHASKQNHRQKESIKHALVEWIITNSQPLNILQSESFIKLIYTLNPYYELLSNKQIKARIHQAYNYSAECLKALLKKNSKH
ncbi:40458_t:CDS:2, partial [Gigaspora margarita]